MKRRLSVRDERWPLAQTFRISRGSKSEAHVVVVEIEQDGHRGRGECVPYARYGETVDSVMAAIHKRQPEIENGIGRAELGNVMKPAAARNAIDCALWDLEAKQAQRPVWSLAGLPEPKPATTAYTISLDTPGAMASRAGNWPLLKLKLGGPDDIACVQAVRAAAPNATLIVDANEAWSIDELKQVAPTLAALGVKLIEQPLPAAADASLAGYECPVPLCADESCHSAQDLSRLLGRYALVNVKLDKAGGLTAALEVARGAQANGLGLMIGSMVATSLAVAPAALLTPLAHFVDLDGPLLLAQDRTPAIRYDGATMFPPTRELWG